MSKPFLHCPYCSRPLQNSPHGGVERQACPDTACAYVHWDNPVPVVAAVVEHGGGVILAHNKLWPMKFFGLITGFLEKHDPSPEQAVLREVHEELGLHGSAAHFIGHDDTLVIGCDSVFDLDGIAYGKPLTAAVAIERIRGMSGRTGSLHTGHGAILGDQSAGRATTTELTFAKLSDTEIAGYVATGEPLNVAGSFTLDGRSAPFIRSITGDPSNVIGISMPTLRNLAGDLGLSWADLWTST